MAPAESNPATSVPTNGLKKGVSLPRCHTRSISWWVTDDTDDTGYRRNY